MTLPNTNEPLRLADGRLVYPGGARGNGDLADTPLGEPRPQVRRKVSDLPALPRQMNAISVILAYTLFGLDEDETASAAGIAPAQVVRIRKSDPYRQMYDAIVRSVLDGEADVVRDLFAKNAKGAAQTMVEALQQGTRADRMAAAKDILDRSGHRPNDVVEHRHRMDGGLTIEIVRKDVVNAPIIDLEPIDDNQG